MSMELFKCYLQAAFLLWVIGTSIFGGYRIGVWNTKRKIRKLLKEEEEKTMNYKIKFIEADK